MISVKEVQLWTGKYHPYPSKLRWVDRLLGQITAEGLNDRLLGRIPDEGYERGIYAVLRSYTERFIKQGSPLVRSDKLQRRLVLQVVYRGDRIGQWSKQALIVRLVYNPDKIYAQLDGIYRYHNKRIPIIGQAILDGKYRIPHWQPAKAEQE